VKVVWTDLLWFNLTNKFSEAVNDHYELI